MILRSLSALLFSSIFLLNINCQDAKKDILINAITKEQLTEVLVTRQDFKPLPFRGDPIFETIDEDSRKHFIEKGETFISYEWPSLLAIRYMDFDLTGNRTNYSDRYFNRRYSLKDLCLAEIIENEGRFMDDIINGLWLVLEETTWVVPAHSVGDKLHDKDDLFVDLFSAETAGLLAWIDYYLGDKLDEVTPLIRKRIYQEVDRRVMQSMLDNNDFWYMGFSGSIPNNWNPWVVSDWLTAVLILENDENKRAESVWKALAVLDQYLNVLPADGGCDEGPSYWGRAGASLFDCLFMIEIATNGVYDVYNEPLVQNLGSYIYKIHIEGKWFVNFSDGSANNSHQPGTLYRIGKAMDDKTMLAMAAEQYQIKSTSERIPDGGTPFGQRTIPDLLIMKELSNYSGEYKHELDYVLPNLEVVISRENEDGSGFFTTIKGGFNNESHNHNDAGSFVIFYNGHPLFVDAGVGVYNKKTFSNERYDIWTMQSAYHNLPSLNGQMQKDGFEYKAENFKFKSTGPKSSVSMDIAGAYPEQSYTKFWQRKFTMDRAKSIITLTDSWDQDKQADRNKWHFLLAKEPFAESEGSIKITNGKEDFLLEYGSHFYTKIEKIEIDDSRLHRVWGDRLWRITLTTGKKGLDGKEIFTIKRMK